MMNRRYLPLLNDETFIDTWLEHFHHLGITGVVTNMFQNVAIGCDAQSTEHDPDWDVFSNIWQGGSNNVAKLLRISDSLKVENLCIPLTVFWGFLCMSLTCIVLTLLPPFSTALRTSARNAIGEGCAFAKTNTWFMAIRSWAIKTFSEPLMMK